LAQRLKKRQEIYIFGGIAGAKGRRLPLFISKPDAGGGIAAPALPRFQHHNNIGDKPMETIIQNDIAIKLSWDEHSVLQNHADWLLQEGTASNEKEAFEMACKDADILEFEFDDFLENFTAILKTLSPSGVFHIEGRNMGWRHLSGSLDLQAQDAREFIEKSFPKTNDWRLEGIFCPRIKELTYRLYHHDAPMGEVYIAT
jgi:hypothetical protein